MPMTPREILKLLKQNCFIIKPNQHNDTSHIKMWNPTTNVTIPVPIHPHAFKKGTEQGILKQAGLK